jgi:hypothetical protein
MAVCGKYKNQNSSAGMESLRAENGKAPGISVAASPASNGLEERRIGAAGEGAGV